jgi:hypothetical protein
MGLEQIGYLPLSVFGAREKIRLNFSRLNHPALTAGGSHQLGEGSYLLFVAHFWRHRTGLCGRAVGRDLAFGPPNLARRQRCVPPVTTRPLLAIQRSGFDGGWLSSTACRSPMVRLWRIARVPPGWGSRDRRFSKGRGLSLRLWLCPALRREVLGPADQQMHDHYTTFTMAPVRTWISAEADLSPAHGTWPRHPRLIQRQLPGLQF